MNPKLHFQRFELKYFLTQTQEKEIKQYLRRYMAPDLFARQAKKGEYEVVSLYYDSPGFYYFHQKMDGVKERKKIRLRTYRSDGVFFSYAFFEIKRKHDAIILKDRFFMSRDDYEKLIDNDDFHSTAAIRDQNRKNIIQEYQWERHLRTIGPKVLVSYIREPYLGKYNENVRVTFDRDIRAMQTDNLFYTGEDMEDISGEMTLMEIKFNRSLPLYIRDMIRQFQLERVSFSKYCAGIEATGSLSATTFPYQYQRKKLNVNLPNREPVWEIF